MFGKKKVIGIEERTNTIRVGSAQLASGMPAPLSPLLALKELNRPIAETAKTQGWKEYEAELTRIFVETIRRLPRKIIDKDPTIEADAHLLENINQVLLGLVNNSIYESANLDRLVNNILTVKSRLEEENERNAR
jgi:hypothetical protein